MSYLNPRIAAKFSTEVLAKLAQEAAEFNLLANPEIEGKYPVNVDEFELTEEVLTSFPHWTASLLRAGSRFERHQFQDGTVIVKLLDYQKRVVDVKKL
jgi:hypothetical protein